MKTISSKSIYTGLACREEFLPVCMRMRNNPVNRNSRRKLRGEEEAT